MGLFGKKKLDKKADPEKLKKAGHQSPKDEKVKEGSEPKVKAAKKKKSESEKTKKADDQSSKNEKNKVVPTVTGDAYKVLVRPIVTEKSSKMAKDGKYVFAVSMESNKIGIKQAVKAVYGVDPVSVQVMRILGKPVKNRYGYGRRKHWRKAIVTLKSGQSIDVFKTNV